MDKAAVQAALKEINSTQDLLERGLKLAGLISTLFAEQGTELVVVGGAAIEFYTEGNYMSGDIDFCRKKGGPVPPRVQQEIIGSLNGSGGPRSWKIGGLFVDLLGTLEKDSRTPFTRLATKYGTISLIPVEELLVERILIAFYPRRDKESELCAKVLLAQCVSGKIKADWKEVDRLAADKRYAITERVRALKKEVADGLKKQ
jgi:hypothetical protein